MLQIDALPPVPAQVLALEKQPDYGITTIPTESRPLPQWVDDLNHPGIQVLAGTDLFRFAPDGSETQLIYEAKGVLDGQAGIERTCSGQEEPLGIAFRWGQMQQRWAERTGFGMRGRYDATLEITPSWVYFPDPTAPLTNCVLLYAETGNNLVQSGGPANGKEPIFEFLVEHRIISYNQKYGFLRVYFLIETPPSAEPYVAVPLFNLKTAPPELNTVILLCGVFIGNLATLLMQELSD